MVQSRCCVLGCSVTKDSGIPLHRFPNPRTKMEKLKQWLDNVGGEITRLDPIKIYDNMRICGKHFLDIHKYPKNRLCNIAMPTLHMSGHNAIKIEPPTAEIATISEPSFPEPKTPSAGVIQEPTTVEKDNTFDEIAPATSEPGLDPDLLDILGRDPSNIEEYGPNINHKLASRLNYIATHGLDKDNRRELLQKYLTPSNCKDISAPILNPEIKAAIPDYIVKRDRSIEINQKQIAAAITCVSNIISTQISSSGRDSKLLKSLMDASRILCDVQHMQSKERRANALCSLKNDSKEQSNNTKIDRFLFEEDLSETIRTAKAVSRSSIDLKEEVRRRPKQNRNLNQKPSPQRHHNQPPITTRPMSSYLPPTLRRYHPHRVCAVSPQ